MNLQEHFYMHDSSDANYIYVIIITDYWTDII